MKSLLLKMIFFIGVVFMFASCTKSYTREKIDKLFEPITSRYGIKVVYEINEDFGPILIGGERARFHKAEPIETRVLVRYPSILKKTLEKYPDSLIKKYLSSIYFAKALERNGLPYGGTYDPFRRIVYLVNNGNKPDDLAIGTFHHEFSSILLKRNTFYLNPWLEQNPKDFKYLRETTSNIKEIHAGAFEGTKVDYEKGFLNAYSQSSFENDFNEYARMIFTYPQKFKRIMNLYPRVRGKFLVWQGFYQRIDPIFTEEYFFQ